jgi:hypothetical protein
VRELLEKYPRLGRIVLPLRDRAKVNGGIAPYRFTTDDVRSIEREVALKPIPRLKQT